MAETHFPLARLASALRADGVKVVVWPGAQGRSARNFAAVGYYVGCQAICQHHTVSSGAIPANDIDYILSGKGTGYVIANAYTAIDGTVYLLASGPTYTEGTGGPLGIIPANRANDVCFSNEIASWGANTSVYPKVQQDAAFKLAFHAARIAADVWSWPGDPFAWYRVFGHHEWAPGRKVDPRGISRWSPIGGTWNMDAHRRELAHYEGAKMIDHPNRRLLDTRSVNQDPNAVGVAFVLNAHEAANAKSLELNVQVVGALGDGWIEANGRSALVYDAGRANATISLAPNTRIDIRVHGAKAHVIVDLTKVER